METKLLVDFNLKKNFKIVLIHKRWFLSNLNIFDDLEGQKNKYLCFNFSTTTVKAFSFANRYAMINIERRTL